ncbi:Type I inositol-1,4,5-trisphosphate 5-phosphatase, partial [Tupaia chinensis]
PENLQKNWLREFYQVVHTHKPHFMALHCQEFGGKNYEASMSHVDKFVKELLSSDAMKEYNRARVYLDENYKSQEHFTALPGGASGDVEPMLLGADPLLGALDIGAEKQQESSRLQDSCSSVQNGTPPAVRGSLSWTVEALCFTFSMPADPGMHLLRWADPELISECHMSMDVRYCGIFRPQFPLLGSGAISAFGALSTSSSNVSDKKFCVGSGGALPVHSGAGWPAVWRTPKCCCSISS